jgi:membrane associated rhomboid family serine protease
MLEEKPMLYSIATPLIVLLLALGASYAITRPIGDNRRHIAAALISLACGVIGGFLEANMGVSVSAALGGAFVGMMIAWRRRNPLGKQQTQSKPRKQGSRRPHYGISRA